MRWRALGADREAGWNLARAPRMMVPTAHVVRAPVPPPTIGTTSSPRMEIGPPASSLRLSLSRSSTCVRARPTFIRADWTRLSAIPASLTAYDALALRRSVTEAGVTEAGAAGPGRPGCR